MSLPVKSRISGSVLKWVAVVTMLIDHIAASGLVDNWNFRLIGRTAFPLFAFLLAEGARHTKDIRKYMVRLGIFSLISEIPFDWGLFGKVFCWEYQNVYWTLLLGLFVIYLFMRYPGAEWKGYFGFAAIAILAEVCRTDYGAAGIAMIVLMYMLHESPWLRFFVCYGIMVLMSLTELWCLPAFVLIAMYNGTRGRQPRYFFYGFYPLHLLILGILR